jgi:AcrR family transcriptional regulator
VARQGLAKTTLDDIAREARFSRATLYRAFPGGKDAVMAAVVETEAARFFSALAVAMGEAHDLEDVLVAGMVEAARRLTSHDALLYLLEHEPGVVLRHLAFAEMDRLLLHAGDVAAPFFARWLEPEQAARAAEWAVRILLSYLSCPSAAVDLTQPQSTRRLVRQFVLPGIQALRAAEPAVPVAAGRASGSRRRVSNDSSNIPPRSTGKSTTATASTRATTTTTRGLGR